MRTLSKIVPIALLAGALLLSVSPAAWADRRIQPTSQLPISSDPEVPNQAYRGPTFKSTVEQPAELDSRPEVRAVLSEVWYRRLLRFIAAQLWGGMVR
jgi:hypothetical protein